MEAKPILVIDDQNNILVTVSRALAKLGRPVETTGYAEDALLRLARTDYAVVLLDIDLWGMSGLEMLQKMREQGVTVPVVMITAHGNPENEAEARRLGAVDFVVKPFSPKEIRERVAKVLSPAP